MVNVVILSANGESRTSKTTIIVAGAPVTGAAVAKLVRKSKAADVIGTYKYKGATLTLWGWEEGKAGTENKHELPPPHDEALFFGDIIVTSSAGNLTVDEWLEFYDAAFGGFDDVGSEDSETGDEEDEEDVDDEDDGDVGEEDEGDAGDDDESVASDVEDDEDGSGSEAEAEEEEEEEGADDDCYDDEEGGGSKRRAPRRRTVTAPEFRRLDMGLKSRVKVPTPPGKRAPRWQTGPELEEEEYD